MLSFFFEILPQFSDSVNSDDCVGQITSKSIGEQTASIQRKIFSIEKMINSGCIYL